MIDRHNRNRLAELLRHLASGQITNDEFEDALPQSSDPAIFEIYFNGAWYLYNDLYEYKLTGKYRLTKEYKRIVARWILFLKSNYEYLWPVKYDKGLLEIPLLFISILTFGFSDRMRYKNRVKAGDIDYWPFISKDDFEKANIKKEFLRK